MPSTSDRDNRSVPGGDLEKIEEIPVALIMPDPNQPRKKFDEQRLKELASSIKKYGLLQPIAVRPKEEGKYQIDHGERRWRACQELGLSTIKCIVKRGHVDEREKFEIQLIENLQREDLNSIDEAKAFKRLIDDFGYTHEQLARRLGKSRVYITNKLRLLKLSPEIQTPLREGKIKEGHARAILSIDQSLRNDLLSTVIEKKMTVRQTEKFVKSSKNVSRETIPNHLPESSGGLDVRLLKTFGLIFKDGEPQSAVSKMALISALIQDLKQLRRL